MAYNKRNKLMQMQMVIDAYLAAKTPDKSVQWVYRHIIFPNFRISRSTLYNYLNTPVKRMLKELDSSDAGKTKVLKLDLD